MSIDALGKKARAQLILKGALYASFVRRTIKGIKVLLAIHLYLPA